MRAHSTFVAAALVLTMAGAADARMSAKTDPHLRPADPSTAALVATALEQSPTIRALASQLDGTDVVAYVQTAPRKAGEVGASIHVAGRTAHQRFFVLRIDESLPAERQIALIGHELQHAVDMASAGWVTDQARLQQYLELTGWKRMWPEKGFETISALRAERRVGQDLAMAAAAGAGGTSAGCPKPR